MTKEEIRILVSELLKQQDKAKENILRRIIFTHSEVNWNQVEKLIKEEMPELITNSKEV